MKVRQRSTATARAPAWSRHVRFIHAGSSPRVSRVRVAFPGVVSAGGGDTGVPGRFQDPDGQVAQGGHGLGSAAGADLGGVFAVADIADVVQCLDLPVAADPGGELGGGGLVGVQAGDGVNRRVSGSRRTPRAARTCGGASATHSPTAVNDVAPASTAATAAINNDVRLCRTPRGFRGSGTHARYSARPGHWPDSSARSLAADVKALPGRH